MTILFVTCQLMANVMKKKQIKEIKDELILNRGWGNVGNVGYFDRLNNLLRQAQ